MNTTERRELLVKRLEAVTPKPETEEEIHAALSRVFRCKHASMIKVLMIATMIEGEESDHLSNPLVDELISTDDFITELEIFP